jgi:hypothetical protein
LRPGDWVTFNGDEHQVVATAIGELLTGFWSTIAGMCHEWRHRWTVDETTAVLETRAHYTTHAGTDVTVSCHHCLVQLKIARNAARLLGFAILIWTIPAPVVRIDIASSATGASGRVERRQHAA